MGERSHNLRSRKWSWVAASLLLLAVAAGIVAADPPGASKKPTNSTSSGTAAPTKSASTKPGNQPGPDTTKKTPTGTPVGTNEPIVARVNNEFITYKALAEECIARKGPEVLDTMISKMLVMQACQQRGIKVTAAEVDEEIGRTAQKLNMSREAFLKMLKEQRDIDPKRYAEDVVLPGLALKKLATPYVKVTETDIEHGFEAMYGEKVKCRWIMFDDSRNAMRVWNELRTGAKPGDGKVALTEFERQVVKWSTDIGSRALGGQIQPISHHTSPQFQELENAAFAMKEDGEISTVVQLGNTYVILYREARIAPANVKLEGDVHKQIDAEIYEAKIRDQIAHVFQGLRDKASIENLLTGDVSTPEKNTAGSDKAGKGNEEPAQIGAAPKKVQPTLKR
ncbi:MAG: peptidylprolyl isomerase [Planctomycetes bacterium]|nr:peptidylprolyl isomerase [Planctomycetota bacterium]